MLYNEEQQGVSKMKKIRLIPFLLVLPLLSSCGAGGKAPTFAKEGVEYDYLDFNDQLQTARNESELGMLTVPLQDRIAKGTYYSLERTIQKRDNNEVYRREYISSSKAEYQFDYDNLVEKQVYEGKDTDKVIRPSDSSNEEYTYGDTVYYQFEKIARSDILVNISANQKTYSTMSTTSDKEASFNSFVINDILGQLSRFNEFYPSNKYDAEGYLFYVNDETLFTFEMSQQKDEDILISGQRFGYKTVKSVIKCQLDLTDKKQAVRISHEISTEGTFEKDYIGMASQNYFKGDKETIEQRTYIDYYVDAQKLNVNPINIDDYDRI